MNRIEKDYIPIVGTTGAIQSDNGSQFISKLWKNTLERYDVKVIYSTRYHPQSNSVERYNREIGRLLRTYCHNQDMKWPIYLKQIEGWMNRVWSEVIELTPQQLMMGIRTEHELEKMIQFPEQEVKPDQQQLVKWAAERIKTKANKREKNIKTNKIETQYTHRGN